MQHRRIQEAADVFKNTFHRWWFDRASYKQILIVISDNTGLLPVSRPCWRVFLPSFFHKGSWSTCHSLSWHRDLVDRADVPHWESYSSSSPYIVNLFSNLLCKRQIALLQDDSTVKLKAKMSSLFSVTARQWWIVVFMSKDVCFCVSIFIKCRYWYK